MSMPVIEAPDPEFVRRARVLLGLTQRELGDRLGLHVRTIKRYEQGYPLPERTKLAIEQLLDRARRDDRKSA